MLGKTLDSTVIDTAIEPAVGWRTWNVGQSFDCTILVSPDRGNIWVAAPGAAMAAHCPHSPEQRLNGELCVCGFNAFKVEESIADEERYRKAAVRGTVTLWGETRELEAGWRGQFAWPKELWVHEDVEGAELIAQGLATTYGCPVHVAPRLAMPQMTAEMLAAQVADKAAAQARLKRGILSSAGLHAAVTVVAWSLILWSLAVRGAHHDVDVSPGILVVSLPLMIGSIVVYLVKPWNEYWAECMLTAMIVTFMLALPLTMGTSIMVEHRTPSVSAMIENATKDGDDVVYRQRPGPLNAIAFAWQYAHLRPGCHDVAARSGTKSQARVCRAGGTITASKVRGT